MVENFGIRLRRLRKERKLTQQQLADRAGRSRPWVTQLESGTRWRGKLPPGDDLRLVADALGLTQDELTGVTPEPPVPVRDMETERLAELGRAVLRLVRKSAPPTLADVVEAHRQRLQREFSPEMYAKIEIAFVETEAAYERMVGLAPDESPDGPATPSVGREA